MDFALHLCTNAEASTPTAADQKHDALLGFGVLMPNQACPSGADWAPHSNAQDRSLNAMDNGMIHTDFAVQTLTDAKQVCVFGETLGHLRSAIKEQFDIPCFQQKLMYIPTEGDSIALHGDDSELMREKPGLLDAKALVLSRQVDPRYKTEKETAFLEALAACHFAEAKEMLEEASGVAIDPNCILKRHITDGFTRSHADHSSFATYAERRVCIGVTECARSYRHPAITVAMIAGLEYAVKALRCNPDAIQEWMSHEEEVCEVVALLIDQGADVNATGEENLDAESAGCPSVDGKSPLCAAIQRGSPTLVRMLLEAKADPNHTVVLGGSAWGPGPGAQKPVAFLNEICNGSMSRRSPQDPRNQYRTEILELLQAAANA